MKVFWWQSEAILDPSLQIITMSEAVCHHLGFQYDLRIWLHMQLANGKVDESLGLTCNVSACIGEIIVYIQVHVICSTAYNILLDQPFNILMCSIVHNFVNKAQTITIQDPGTGTISTVPKKPRGRLQHYLPSAMMAHLAVEVKQQGNFCSASRI